MKSTDIVSISRFNKGEATTIFNEVSAAPKYVVKNNKPVCVLINPVTYDKMVDQLKEARIILNAVNSKEGFETLQQAVENIGEDVDIDGWEDVELE